MLQPKTTKENIIEEFRRIGDGSVRFMATRSEVLDFIFKKIDQVRLETIKEVEEMLPEKKQVEYLIGDDNFKVDYEHQSFNDCLNQIQTSLNKLK